MNLPDKFFVAAIVDADANILEVLDIDFCHKPLRVMAQHHNDHHAEPGQRMVVVQGTWTRMNAESIGNALRVAAQRHRLRVSNGATV